MQALNHCYANCGKQCAKHWLRKAIRTHLFEDVVTEVGHELRAGAARHVPVAGAAATAEQGCSFMRCTHKLLSGTKSSASAPDATSASRAPILHRYETTLPLPLGMSTAGAEPVRCPSTHRAHCRSPNSH